MGDLIDRAPPQWKKREPVESDEDALVLRLAATVLRVLTDEAVPTPAQIAVLMLVQRAVVSNYAAVTDVVSARRAYAQAEDLAKRYSVYGADGVEL